MLARGCAAARCGHRPRRGLSRSHVVVAVAHGGSRLEDLGFETDSISCATSEALRAQPRVVTVLVSCTQSLLQAGHGSE